MDYYIILNDNNIYTKTENDTNSLPFTYGEAKNIIHKMDCPNAKCINISKDLRAQNIPITNNPLLEQKQNLVNIWRKEFLDNNINGFLMPRIVNTNEEYINELKKLLTLYRKEIQKISFKYEDNLVLDVEKNCEMLLNALDFYIKGNKNDAREIIFSVIQDYIYDTFWVSDLDKSYAFRGIAPFVDLHSSGHEEIYMQMMKGAIDFYRARMERITNRKDILHIPYKLIDIVKEQRFSLPHQPCLYLGTTSYVCWEECGKPNLEDFYIAGFKANEKGKKLKIFNLVASEPLVNGIWQKGTLDIRREQLQNSMIRLLPIVFATSFTVNDNSRKVKKFEYIIPHLIMQSLSELNIDGVAYLSKKGKNDFQYPQGVNLAIPVSDINEQKQYSDLCNKFIITNPVSFTEILNQNMNSETTSYIYGAFKNYYHTREYEKDYKDFQIVDNKIPNLKYG